MFKYGDDIKQDHLVLQLFTIFNKIWIEAGYDLKMNIYKVLSTGNGIGFIEIVQNA
jgi:phosphatidylinositol kinase/protein kinase (PI-3  family)